MASALIERVNTYKKSISSLQTTIKALERQIEQLHHQHDTITDAFCEDIGKDAQIPIYVVGTKDTFKIETNEKCEWISRINKKAIFFNQIDAQNHIDILNLEDSQVWQEVVSIETFASMVGAVYLSS